VDELLKESNKENNQPKETTGASVKLRSSCKKRRLVEVPVATQVDAEI